MSGLDRDIAPIIVDELKRYMPNLVEVVRCKDCTYGEDAKGVAEGVVECKRLKMVTKDDWYCAEGRRNDK